jgi:hypothetical protein
MREFHQDLGVRARTTQPLEHFRHLLNADYVGHHRLRADHATGQSIDSFIEVRLLLSSRRWRKRVS